MASPRDPSVLVFEAWPVGGMVQSKCTSPDGQVCWLELEPLRRARRSTRSR
jgi:hypothetical protein